jgi:hypothetical protein
MRDLKQIKALRSFLIQQAVPLKGPENAALSFGHLNTLHSPRMALRERGRRPTLPEWTMLEEYTAELYSHLDGALRRRFLYGQIPMWVSQTAVALGIAGLAGLVFTAFFELKSNYLLLSYMVWMASLGSLGSIAFIGMNALSVQDDATFDLTNSKLISLRIALGALFAVVLSLPFGFRTYVEFCLGLRTGGTEVSSGVAMQAVLLLLPFILGFSTPLVIMILNQFVEAVQSFFGKKTSPPVDRATTQTRG